MLDLTRARAALMASLPRRSMLSDADWSYRHRAVLVGLALASVTTLLVGVLRHPTDVASVLLDMVPVAIATLAGVRLRSKALRETAVCIAILQCCGLLVYFSAGLTEAHFSFFVMLPLIALYHDWKPFALSVVFVAVEHGAIGMAHPTGAFDHGTDPTSAWVWTAVHTAFVLALSIVMLVYWNISDRQRLRLEVALDELRTAEQHLGQAQKLEAIGQLAAGIAHEINTPVQFVTDNTKFVAQSFGELLDVLAGVDAWIADHPETGGPVEVRALGDLLRAADLRFLTTEVPTAIAESLEGLGRVAEIVRAMKDFSHPGTGLGATDVNRAVESTVQVSRNEWRYVADLSMDLDPAVGVLPCYEGELKQVVLNVIVNAAHAIAELRERTSQVALGLITVTSRREDAFVRLTVGDDGAGMSEETRARVFDPFFTTKGVGKGTGQGLSIAHATIVRKLGGRIEVSSELGRGTTFSLLLPLQPVAGEAAAAEPTPALATAAHR